MRLLSVLQKFLIKDIAIIVQVTWIADHEESRSHFLLLSIGTDGKVLIWDYLEARRELKLLRGFSFLTESIPRSLRISKAKGDAAIGGTYRNSYYTIYSGTPLFRTPLGGQLLIKGGVLIWGVSL